MLTETITIKQPSAMHITGAGKLIILNTGGSSAAEGGMGTGADKDTEKGEIQKENQQEVRENNEDHFDPIKRNVERAEQERKNNEG